jgi:hypothetical protein
LTVYSCGTPVAVPTNAIRPSSAKRPSEACVASAVAASAKRTANTESTVVYATTWRRYGARKSCPQNVLPLPHSGAFPNNRQILSRRALGLQRGCCLWASSRVDAGCTEGQRCKRFANVLSVQRPITNRHRPDARSPRNPSATSPGAHADTTPPRVRVRPRSRTRSSADGRARRPVPLPRARLREDARLAGAAERGRPTARSATGAGSTSSAPPSAPHLARVSVTAPVAQGGHWFRVDSARSSSRHADRLRPNARRPGDGLARLVLPLAARNQRSPTGSRSAATSRACST